ncbi:MAG: hypothetical protein AAFR73_03925 [Pseudomonadota bacterium]
MTLPRFLMTSSALALVSTVPAYADLTAEQVLADQIRQVETYGLSASVDGESRSGDTLTVEQLTATADTPEGVFTMTMPGATFRELGDGTVEVTYPAELPISLEGTTGTGEAFEMVMSLAQTNMQMLVSGIPEEIRYDFTADSISIDDISFAAPEEAAELDMNIALQMNGLAGVMSFIGGGTIRDYSSNFKFDSMSAVVDAAPEGEGAFSLAMEVSDITADYSGTVGPQDLMASFAQAIESGNSSEGTASHGALTYTVAGQGPDGAFELAAAIASGDFDFILGKSGLNYGTTANDMTLSVGGDVIPLPPLTFKMARVGFNFGMPVVPSEEEQNFGLAMNFNGLEIDQMLWGMFDPVGQIPRDPANLVIDVDGGLVMEEDVFDPAFAEQMTGVPGQINFVNINEILLSLAGAELAGDGEFTFNNEGPVPMPSGVANFMLTGGNGLLDTLVNMGLLPEEQAMGARMMMGMFARPGDGPDTLVSTIEVQEDGAIIANGQRIR